jgi:HEAT repeat protein
MKPPAAEEKTPASKQEITPPKRRQAKAEVAKPQQPATALAAIVKRRQKRTEEELVKEMGASPSVALDRTATRAESNALIKAAQVALATGNVNHERTLAALDLRADLAGLPLRRGRACRLPRAAAAHFGECSADLRRNVSDSTALRKQLSDSKPDKWLKVETVPVLMQMLMAEASAVREVLVEQLSRIKGKQASVALAQLTLFDLSPTVRSRAINELATRDAKDYQHALLRGFGHPWPVIADHAAEALVALKSKEAVPPLVKLLAKPDPRSPYRKDDTDRFFVKEVVRVNHLGNCLLCHPPSFNEKDKIRGLIPSTNEPLVSGQQVPVYYAAKPGGLFVRADITYLKQDFSVMLPVAKPGKWPAVQRFDFFVRERLATPHDLQAALVRKKAGSHEHQESMFFALRELTGRDLGPKAADWRELIPRAQFTAQAAPGRP